MNTDYGIVYNVLAASRNTTLVCGLIFAALAGIMYLRWHKATRQVIVFLVLAAILLIAGATGFILSHNMSQAQPLMDGVRKKPV